ncbi:MAG: methionine adenosyltransferase [Tissierellia bacterium]|nr:methionine adenosyltransferase [Tissierellia bacterium]
MSKLFITSESVTEGHPDKICDQIADGILDKILEDDKDARVACECAVTTGLVLVMGEITTKTYVDVQTIAREIVRDIGYDRGKYGFDCDNCAVITSINEQSPDIAMGVNESLEYKEKEKDEIYDLIGAGDQGMMFGYATDESREYMPLPLQIAHELCRQLAKVRKDGTLAYLRPDGKSQVTIEYDNGEPMRIDAIVVSTQHDAKISTEQLRRDVKKHVINEIVDDNLLDDNTRFYINPTGRFEIGGPKGDSGLTGRKIIVDTYGGFGHHGGGSFSGKDPTKVDRSGAYMARYIAKNLVAAGLCKKCEVGLSYAIGVARPISVFVDCFGTETIDLEKFDEIVRKHFDMRPAAIIDTFDLRRPIYRQVAAYGHFGRNDLDLPWERLDKVEELKKYR